MKIICTAEEKEAFTCAYDVKPELPCCMVNMEPGCAYRYDSCKECLEENIEWIIEGKSDGK